MNPYLIISKILENHKIELSGWTLLQQPLTISFYKDWLDHKNQGSMDYLKLHLPLKDQPQQMANSAIVIAIPYTPHPHPLAADKNYISHLQTALYSQGEDYHFWLKEKLKNIVQDLQITFPNEIFHVWTDSGPVLERDLAYRSGLGWFGKNTCLIHRQKGSLFLLGEIYTTLHLENQNPLSADFCGSCNRCMEACPTQAIEAPRKLNANKCISYWTIESKDIPPQEIRSSMQNWLFGCDICQTVCPWNKGVLKKLHSLKEPNSTNDIYSQKKLRENLSETLNENLSENLRENSKEHSIAELKWILTSSHKELQRAFFQTAYSRAAGAKLKRNALIVIANSKYTELKPSVIEYAANPTTSPELKDLSQWCLNQLSLNL